MATKKTFKSVDPTMQFISGAQEEPAAASTDEQQQGLVIPKGYRLAKENKSERMQLLVRPTLKEGIKKAADAQGISTNDLVNNIFEEYLERKGK